MERVFSSADKEVLAEVVRFAQKQEMKGADGGWKDFLKCHDKKFGTSLSDPAKRPKDVLIAFLKTFTATGQKFFDKLIRRYSGRRAMEQFMKDFPDKESPEQRLVRLTMEYPRYAQHYSFPSCDEGWIVIPPGRISEAMNSREMVSVDCEMVLCQDGTEAVVKVCAVDQNLKVKLDTLVKPNKVITDYRTHITGISAKDLEGVTCSLIDVQNSLKGLLSHGTILIGHSLHNDLQALKIDHARVIDTSYIFSFVDLPTVSPSLNNLCKSVLGYAVRKEGEPHNCLNDAQAAMKLVLAKLEHGFNDPISFAGNNVPDSDLAKLLLHKIPVDVPSQELQKLFSGDNNCDIKSDLRVRGQSYSTFAVFKDARDADEAFKRLEGQEDKDSSGRAQKQVFLTLSNGQTTSLYVRRMTANVQLNGCHSLKKRGMQHAEDDNDDPKKQQEGEETNDSKRQRTCLHPCEHVKEIEKLKQELRQREDEIFSLQKILTAIARRHGL